MVCYNLLIKSSSASWLCVCTHLGLRLIGRHVHTYILHIFHSFWWIGSSIDLHILFSRKMSGWQKHRPRSRLWNAVAQSQNSGQSAFTLWGAIQILLPKRRRHLAQSLLRKYATKSACQSGFILWEALQKLRPRRHLHRSLQRKCVAQSSYQSEFIIWEATQKLRTVRMYMKGISFCCNLLLL